MRALRACLAAALAMTGVLAAVPSAEAAHHLVKIRQVYPGAPGAEAGNNHEYVVLQLTSPFENQFSTYVTVTLYGPTGTAGNSATSSGNPANSSNQAAVFVATQASDGAFSPLTRDMTFSTNDDVLTPGGGAACLTSGLFGAL